MKNWRNPTKIPAQQRHDFLLTLQNEWPREIVGGTVNFFWGDPLLKFDSSWMKILFSRIQN
ncbi:hypothetical protein [Nostoc sp. LPT]|uniref:hypothetical protein n=1 Tax=Nostoc sp. LPT TaxID=2815387 RepID=UPI001D28D543|nr:hypothetical protein [Nostoc sp. LPT]MBN4005873.1 hypothetical protein [Nostoc sp. LPT]